MKAMKSCCGTRAVVNIVTLMVRLSGTRTMKKGTWDFVLCVSTSSSNGCTAVLNPPTALIPPIASIPPVHRFPRKHTYLIVTLTLSMTSIGGC